MSERSVAMIVSVLFCSTSAAAQTTHSLTVSKHSTVSATAANVDAILVEASNVLKVDDDFAPGTGDVACDVTLVRSGAVGPFSSAATPGTIAKKSDLDAVFAEPAFVKMVTGITWCGRSGSIAGCAATPGRTIAVVHPGKWRGIVWAHEFGHSTGLPHRGLDRELMTNEPLAEDQTFVSTSECRSIVGGPPARALSPGLPTPSGGRAGGAGTVDEIIASVFVDSVPYALIARLPASDASVAARVLDQTERQQDWPNAMTVLGILGDAGHRAKIIRYLGSAAPVNVDPGYDHQTRLAALLALGYQLNRADDAETLNLLRAVASGTTKAARAPATEGRAGDGAEEAYATTAGWALALSGRPSALSVLTGRTGEAALTLRAPLANELAQTNRLVARRGLAAYYAAAR